MRAADVRTSARRVAVARAVLVLLFVGLAARATHLSVFDRRAAARGDAQTLRTLTLAPERGHVVDRSGADLALSVDAPSVYVIPAQLEDAGKAASALAPILGVERRVLAKRLADRKGFLFLARWIDDEREWRSSAGWNVVAILAQNEGLTAREARSLISRIRKQLHGSPNRTRHSMNNALIAMGGAMPTVHDQAIKAARAIGKVEVDHGETGCKTRDAEPYIARMVAHRNRPSRAKKKAASRAARA